MQGKSVNKQQGPDEPNDHAIAHLWVRWEFPQGLNGPMTMPLQIYRPRQFHKTSDGMNPASVCEVTGSTKIWVPDRNSHKGLMDHWPCHCTLGTKMVPCRAWKSLNQSSSCVVTMSARIWLPDRNALPQTGQWPYHCSSTGQDSSIELEIIWIGPVVVGLQCLQDPDGQMGGRMDEDHFIVPLTFLQKVGGNFFYRIGSPTWKQRNSQWSCYYCKRVVIVFVFIFQFLK